MELMLDTINIEKINFYHDCLNISGVTSNPSIFKKEGRVDFIKHMKEIRQVIGVDKSLHIQVIGETYEEMIQDAETILKQIDTQVYIKVSVSTEGLKVIKELKRRGINVTATAIYSVLQGLLAINVGADYIAPYYNRMAELGINSNQVVQMLHQNIKTSGSSTKILAASFKNTFQMIDVLSFGADAVTVGSELLDSNLDTVTVKKAIADFKADWFSLYEKGSI